MFYLTRQQEIALATVILMLLTGWAVKAYRTGHPSPPGSDQPTTLDPAGLEQQSPKL